jgi:type I site-specific restriction-modification system R (restriction) subunit
MPREQDRQKLQRLMDEIDTLKHQGIDHQHPKFQEWKKEARSTLRAIYGETAPILTKFEELDSRRKEDRMWEEEHDIRGKKKAVFKMDMERARDFLEEALKVSHLLGEEGKGLDEEAFISTVSKGALQDEAAPAAEQTPAEAPAPPAPPPVSPATPRKAPAKEVKERRRKKVSAEEVSEVKREKDIAELLHELEKEKKDLERVQVTLEEALEGVAGIQRGDEAVEELLIQLEEQIKDPAVEMRKVQKTMEELLRVKGKKALLQRLTEEIKDPTVPWGKVRELMKGVWEIDRKLLIEILPDLLED